MVQYPVVTLALEPKAVVFDSGGRGDQLIVRPFYRYAVGERARIEYVEAIRKAKGGVAGGRADWAPAVPRG